MVRNHHTVVCFEVHNRIHCILPIHLHPCIHLHPRIRNPDTIVASGNMVHQQVHSQHRIHFVARTKIHTHIRNPDSLDAPGNLVHQQVVSESRSSLVTMFFDQQGLQTQPPPPHWHHLLPMCR
ncbi:hypothetical protein Hanom_Chr03g00185201 [Helianthus anomalus]